MRAMLYALFAIAWLLVGFSFTQFKMRDWVYSRLPIGGFIAVLVVSIYFVASNQRRTTTHSSEPSQPVSPPPVLRCSKSLNNSGASGTGFIDSAQDAISNAAVTNGAVVRAGTELTVIGWLSNTNASLPADEACILLDGAIVAKQSGTYGMPRPDVAAQLKNPALNATGYELRFSTSGMRLGRHTLQVGAVCGVPRRYSLIRSKISFTIRR